MSTAPSREERFRLLYADAYDDVLRFVQRRIALDRAEDVVAEAMLVVWRRVDEVPSVRGDARAWVFGIARNCLLNGHRTRRRHDALAVRLADPGALASASGVVSDAADLVVRRVDVSAAWARLSASDQEVLALSVFEDLTSRQAGAVLGISAEAFRLRLSRVRRALRRDLEGAANRVDTLIFEEMH
ncbi:MAG: RNA polymerase sigma factor [Propionibacteriaceae bacterium]|nr:RNA polymerase sigma factor [Propionibacteriaceae bacterium]